VGEGAVKEAIASSYCQRYVGTYLNAPGCVHECFDTRLSPTFKLFAGMGASGELVFAETGKGLSCVRLWDCTQLLTAV
jgi:hypothetical protein